MRWWEIVELIALLWTVISVFSLNDEIDKLRRADSANREQMEEKLAVLWQKLHERPKDMT